MTEADFIHEKRHELPHQEWIKMMQERKTMQAEGKSPEQIVVALQADERFKLD